MNKKFSIPYNPQILFDLKLRDEYFSFLNRNKNFIVDIYFGYQAYPFTTDARAGHVVGQGQKILDDMIKIKRDFNIDSSATFNGQLTDKTEDAYRKFLEEIKNIHSKGVKAITLNAPFWVKRLQHDCPNLVIKNTVVNPLGFPQEVFRSYDYIGFDVIFIREDLIKDRESLKRLLKVRDKMGRQMGIIMNHRACIHYCPIKDQHYIDGNNRKNKTDESFYLKYCIANKDEVADVLHSRYQRASVFPIREHYQWFFDNFDYLKMVGRTEVTELRETMEIIDSFNQTNSKILRKKWFNKLLKEIRNTKKVKHFFDKHINCKGDCVFCDFCEKAIKEKI